MPRPPGSPAPMPFWPVWNSAGTPSCSIAAHSVGEGRVVGRERLQARVELEPAHAVVLDQPPGPVDGRRTLVRIDRAERDQHVVVPRGRVGDLLAGQRRVAGGRGGVDREHHGGEPGGAVPLGEVVDGRGAVLGALEVGRGRVHQLLVQRQVTVPVGLDVDVHVDRGDGVEVDGGFVAGHRVRLSQPGLEQLAGRVVRQVGDELDRLRHLVARQPGRRRWRSSSSASRWCPSRTTTNARPTSPQVGSATPMTAHSATAGWVYIACSTSAG